MNEVKLLIGGKWRAAQADRSFNRIDPVKGTAATTAAAATVADVNAAIEAAASAFADWAATGPSRRRELLLRAAELLIAHMKEFIALTIAETGGTEGWAGFNVMFGASILREAASMTSQITGEVIPSDVPDNLAMGIRQPMGVCAGDRSWSAGNSWRKSAGDGPSLREHGRIQGVRGLSGSA